jgi:hypothetical protein
MRRNCGLDLRQCFDLPVKNSFYTSHFHSWQTFSIVWRRTRAKLSRITWNQPHFFSLHESFLSKSLSLYVLIMDVNKDNFFHLLPEVLRDISVATFVSIDVEMGGITMNPHYGPNGRHHQTAKPSLEEEYLDIRESASKYQVLQFGLTCIKEDRHQGRLMLSSAVHGSFMMLISLQAVMS